MPEPLSPEDVAPDLFTPHIDQDFRIPGWPHPMRLTAVDIRPAQPRGRQQPFTLIFCGPPHEVMREGFYTAQLEEGPWFNLYLMPIHTVERDRQDYQAVFN